MKKYVEFSYDTLAGETLEISGQTDGSVVKFIAYLDNEIAPRYLLKQKDITNIEEFILNHAEDELHFYDLDYRDER